MFATATCARVETDSNVNPETPSSKGPKYKGDDTQAREAGKRSKIYLMDFFDSCLPSMVAPKKHINSKGTREFGFYDRHLDERLRLTKVVCQPNLACDLAEIAEVALDCYLETYKYLPPIIGDVSHPFPGPKKREEALLKSEFERCVNESCVQRTYAATTAKHCTVVAATLEFHLPRWAEGILLWDLNPERGHTQAVADGFLKLRDLSEEPTHVGLSHRSDLYLRTQKDFAKGLGIWESKSLEAGDKDVLDAILAHSRLPDFPWKSCNHRKVCRLMCGDKGNSKACSEGSDGSQSIWEKTGPDADPPVTSASTSSHADAAQDTEVTIPRLMMEKARRMLQQIWSEMVKTDTTFACFNTGINELILRSNRNENALYISSIIGTDHPGYFKQRTGLYIAMLRDAKQRSLQIKSSPPPTWQDTTPFPTGVTVGVLFTPDEKQESILSEVKTRPLLILKPPRQKARCFTFCKDSPYDRVDPRTFFRSDPAPDYNIDARHVLVTAEPEGIASMGSISVDGVKFTGCSLLHSSNVYTKHANYDLESRKRLQWEASVYSELRKLGIKGCVPEFFGFFRHANIERDQKKPTAGYLTLLIGHTGTSLAQLPHATWPDVANKCHQILSQMHAVGFCHGNISLEHIIYQKGELLDDKITFVSLGRAILNPDEEMKKREHDSLDAILANCSLKRKCADE